MNEAVQEPSPPLAGKRPRVQVVHGDRLQDDYFWLREKSNPEVAAYLEAENDYAHQILAFTQSLQDSLYREMLARIKETDLNVPYKEGDWYYNSRTEEGKQYPIHFRSRRPIAEASGSDTVADAQALPRPPVARGVGGVEAEAAVPSEPVAPEAVTVDLNALAQGLEFMALGAYEVSDDGNLLAYSSDSTGFREYTLRIKDLRTGKLLSDRIERVNMAAWAADNRTLFYTTEDHAKRPYRLYRHVLGSDADELVYEEQDELFRIYVWRTRSDAYVILHSASLTTSEARFLSAGEPSAAWRIVAPRKQGREYDLDHHGERFWIRVNDAGRNFRLVSAPVSDPSESSWREEIPHRDDVMLEAVDFFAGHFIAYEREGGLPQLRVTDLGTREVHHVAFPEPAYQVSASTNEEWDTRTFRYAYESLVTPLSIYGYDMDSRTSTLLKRTEVLGGYDPKLYSTERLHAEAEDGTRVPISLVRRKDVALDGTAPLFLYGYGAYGYAYPVTFSSERLSLLDRGAVFAIAHIRGGGELGKPWHDQGRMMNKMNTFTDFIAAAEFLIAEGYASPDRLVISGGSAGGLLMGAVTNLRPDLFRAVVSYVPFVDVINTMLDASLPLTVTEYEEWGNPNRHEEYDYLKRYCPYTNVAAKQYPAIFVRTSFNDSQVMYWEPAKYVAKLRSLKTDANPLLFLTDMGAGHGGASGRYDRLHDVALDLAFVLWQMGLVDDTAAG
ncbi:MAG: S9 family peptidase [Gemmatimonadota bacterium]